MKILITGAAAWNHPIPYYVAPKREARALGRAGHEVLGLDCYLEPFSAIGLSTTPLDVIYKTSFGRGITTTLENYRNTLRQVVENFKPDIVHMVWWIDLPYELNLIKNHGIPVGLNQPDPFWSAPGGKVAYPDQGTIDFYKKADFFTCQEGQAWNYYRLHGMEGKVHLLQHAIDPELAPTFAELQRTPKDFMMSIVAGGEDPYRRIEQILYFYQWTVLFPEQTFVIGGGLGRCATKIIDEFGNCETIPMQPFTEENLIEIKDYGYYSYENILKDEFGLSPEEFQKKYSNRAFNLTRIREDNCSTFPTKKNPLTLCHKFVHRLYSRSYYGFTPWGWYLRKGPQSEYNTRTFGTKTTEQGGSGAAMVANRIQDIEMYIINGKTGFILEKPEDMKDAIQYAIDNPDEVRKMGENAYKHLHENHSWDNRYREVLAPIFKDLGLI